MESHKAKIFSRSDGKLQAFLDFVLAQYVSQGVEELDEEKLASLVQLKYHTIANAADELGGIPVIRDTFIEISSSIYTIDPRPFPPALKTKIWDTHAAPKTLPFNDFLLSQDSHSLRDLTAGPRRGSTALRKRARSHAFRKPA